MRDRREELREEIVEAAIEQMRMPFTPDPVKNHSYRLSKAVAEYNTYMNTVGTVKASIAEEPEEVRWEPSDEMVLRAQRAEGLDPMVNEEFDRNRFPHIISRLIAYYEEGLIFMGEDASCSVCGARGGV